MSLSRSIETSENGGGVRVPRHVAIMPDGTRRWTQENHGEPSTAYLASVKRLPSLLESACESGVEVVTFHAFSGENWDRSPAEVDFFMSLFQQAGTEILPELHERGFRVRFIGRRDDLPRDLVAVIREAEELTGENEAMDLVIAINYSGQTEIVDAARRLVSKGVSAEDIDEKVFAECLYDPQLPEVDLLIRPGREVRISNFLIWGLAHAELYFTDTLWPDFDETALFQALDEYSRRHRRRGK